MKAQFGDWDGAEFLSGPRASTPPQSPPKIAQIEGDSGCVTV